MLSDDAAEEQGPANNLSKGTWIYGPGKYFVYPCIRGTLQIYVTQ